MVMKRGVWPVLLLLVATAHAKADEPFATFQPIVEINASDGDVGFHVLLAGGPWRWASVLNRSLDRQMNVRSNNGMRQQGYSELFVESAEPLCWNDPEAEPGTEVRTVREFTDRFPAGTYLAIGRGVDRGLLYALAEFSHSLPAAPVATSEVFETMTGVTVEISWEPGTDLGRCAYDDAAIPDPATVVVERWEVAFEPDLDELPAGFEFASKYSVLMPADSRSMIVPEAFLAPWLAAGVTEYKFEIGAKERSGNQTFTEVALEIEP